MTTRSFEDVPLADLKADVFADRISGKVLVSINTHCSKFTAHLSQADAIKFAHAVLRGAEFINKHELEVQA